ncbi:MAG: hypothetical protein COU11_01790 [Candidatus Harrisonbacteria bacterium CG10_big_fil_rev_8_21_14_0_10_49_15]|uniref:Uncharacterized protein n=1 Tax=Candidatus Harrisonbacteria bacterium CG10_big_fil_rev_8_21_14_0_10_49_15 TaxID=1974587 RepID=A0A2H0ULA6_9BACT|nr:MAG: hypothetical protein COU11_01790 [Candidatus Harrisonbacteria bacterium CG10_big_fil_rev_8_21_14_0_10_49_15]
MSAPQKKEKPTGLPTTRWMLQLPILAVSIAAAIYLAQSNVIEQILTATSSGTGLGFIVASFIAGIFYATFFGVVPATVTLIEVAQAGSSPLVIGIFGGLGAVIGDLSLFQIIRFGIVDDLVAAFQRRSQGAFKRLFKIRFFKTFLLAIGAVILATPIPDEIGLTMLGIAKTNWRLVAAAGFVCNAIGIYLLALITQVIVF